MNLAYSTNLRRRSLLTLMFCLSASMARADAAPASPPAAPPAAALRIKNGRSIRVVLGFHRHEPASAIRPENGSWTIIMMSALPGAAAELQDLTPNAPRSRWTMGVQGDRLVLDAHRFLPTHVYQLEVRKEKRLVGSALVYLYPPPTDSVGHVEFKDNETAKRDEPRGPSSVPKGDL